MFGSLEVVLDVESSYFDCPPDLGEMALLCNYAERAANIILELPSTRGNHYINDEREALSLQSVRRRRQARQNSPPSIDSDVESDDDDNQGSRWRQRGSRLQRGFLSFWRWALSGTMILFRIVYPLSFIWHESFWKVNTFIDCVLATEWMLILCDPCKKRDECLKRKIARIVTGIFCVFPYDLVFHKVSHVRRGNDAVDLIFTCAFASP